ncbi:hypothetical protein PHYSODRAFT_348623 [Phytophthora sojae]|uniref:Uncharacterized protein n=1 Tax=Phytophthora sojae (strain P6497) TaxID=1094619 RepID=G5AGK5_PHYSP|nr:hypothetical protein PHYSODRAFT_348623 [Phytophthora sojae]EGZ05285.1 hypothetical protein PHYSODRAFT_348623 [Phytophthora sojae]|eukprot:XP_009539206.1 hypothetical protein PHYSODRAFT_348623 [Phytophthora sojae]
MGRKSGISIRSYAAATAASGQGQQADDSAVQMQIEASERATLQATLDTRPINTKRKYETYQTEFQSWCSEKQFCDGATATKGKLHLFLTEQVVGRESKKKKGTFVGGSTVCGYVNAIVDLDNQQVALKINSNAHPRSAQVKQLIKNVQAQTTETRNKNYQDRGVGSLLDGYHSEEQFRQICDTFFLLGDLRGRAAFLVSHFGSLRGENARNLELADMFSQVLDGEGFQTCIALVILIQHGKTNTDLERNLLEERHHRQTAEYAPQEPETIKQLHETNKELRDAMKKEIEANEDHRKTIEHQQDLIDKGIKSNEIQQRMIQDLQRELPALRHQLRQQQVQNHSDMDNLRLEFRAQREKDRALVESNLLALKRYHNETARCRPELKLLAVSSNRRTALTINEGSIEGKMLERVRAFNENSRAGARAEEDKRVKTEITFHHSKEKNLKRTISRGKRTREISVKASDTVVVPGVVDEARLKIDNALDAAGLRDEVAIRYLRRGIKYDKHEGVDEIVFDSLDEVVASHRASSSDKYCKASTYLLLNDVLVTPVWQFEVV